MAENEMEVKDPKVTLKGKPWGAWWQNKRSRDETLWSAAAISAEAIREALKAPQNGDASAQVNSRWLSNRTGLHIAAFSGNKESVEVLLEAGADVEARTDTGLTALHVACRQGHVEVARVLIDNNSELLSETNDQSLALHLAAAAGHAEVCDLLIAGGSSQLLHRNNIAQRPLDVAGNIRTFELLKQLDHAVLGSQGEGTEVHVDSYAGRTPLRAAGVMLRNSRADVMQRLLLRTHRATPARPTLEMHSARSEPRKSAEQRFTHLRKGAPSVEAASIDAFIPQKKLGQGSFGSVYKVTHKKTHQIYAMKILEKSNICASNSLLKYTMTERNLLSYIKHPYMVSLHYAFQTPSHLVLVLEFCPNGNIQDLLKQTRRLNEAWSQLYTAEVLLALCYLHERETVYRDLKPENVVLDAEGHAMLTDFGLSKEGVAGIRGTKSFCGSVAFMAPEVLRRSGHGHTVDIYGLGVLTYCMLVGAPPFFDRRKEALVSNIKHGTLRVPSFVSQEAASFIEATMKREPKQRLGARCSEDCQTHEWFKSTMDFGSLMRREVPLPEAFESLMPSSDGDSMDLVTATVVAKYAKLSKDKRPSREVEGWNFASPQSTVE